MGVKKTLPQTVGGAGLKILSNGAMASTNTITSMTFNANNIDNIGIQVIWSGTPTGTFSVNCSIDTVTWDALTFNPTLQAPSGSAGHFLINLNQLPYPYAQLTYTNTSGSGTLNAWLSAKDLN